jgi:NADPH:quinone reductase-like Zn-dependent oxidoreductase
VKAAVYRRYGPPDVIRIEEVDAPIPGDGEVLIAVRAASVNPLDSHLMKGRPLIARLAFGLTKPKSTRPGVDVAGIVAAVGAGVTLFRPGDAVFGSCRGALAELACAAESKLAVKPANMSFAQAAAVPVAGVTALQGRGQGRAEDTDQRRGGRRRHLRGPDRQGLWRGGDGRVQRAQSRHGPIDRRGPGRGLLQ